MAAAATGSSSPISHRTRQACKNRLHLTNENDEPLITTTKRRLSLPSPALFEEKSFEKPECKSRRRTYPPSVEKMTAATAAVSKDPLSSSLCGIRTRSKSGRHIFDLPPEILTQILLYIDIKSLLINCRCVCQRFNAVITGEFFNKMKLLEDFGSQGYAKVVEAKGSPTDLRRFFNVNLYQGMSRWGVYARPFVSRIKKDHQCSDWSRNVFQTANSSSPQLRWMDEPPCYCIFGRSVSATRLRHYSEVYGWCMIELSAWGIPTEMLDLVRPPIAIGLWDPHPESRWGLSAGLKARLTAEDNETLARGEYIPHPQSRTPVLQYIVFSDYPPGVRRIVFSGPNSFLLQGKYGRANFVGATVKLLPFSHGAISGNK